MRKSMIIALLTLLCMSFAGCKNKSSEKSESQQPDIKVNYVEDESSDSSTTSEEKKDTNVSDNSDYSDSEKIKNKNAATTDSEYVLSSADGDIGIISGKEYDSGETNIHGTVLGIGKYTVTMNKAFTAEYTPDGKYIDANTMVSYENPDEQVIEYVQFTEESTFTLRETHNNGADAKDSPAAFEDIKKDDLLDIRGYYIDGIFNAVNTIIYRNPDI